MISLERIYKIRKKASGILIVVEGKRDKVVLSDLGWAPVLTISGKTLENVADEVEEEGARKVVILTDFDREGERKHKKLRKILERRKIRTDYYIRKKFKSLFEVHKIEELSSLAKYVASYGSGELPEVPEKILNKSKFSKRRNHKKKKTGRSE